MRTRSTSLILLYFCMQIICCLIGHGKNNVFQAISVDDPILRTLWYNKGSEKNTIVATAFMRSRNYEYDIGPNLIFYADRLDEDGKPIPEAIVQIPPGASQLLLFFNKLESPNHLGLNYEIMALKDDFEGFPLGTFRFINATSRELAVKISDEKIALPIGSSQIVEVSPTGKDLGVDIATYLVEDEMWTRAYSNRWGHRENLRTLVFVVDNPKGGVRTLRYRQTEPTK